MSETFVLENAQLVLPDAVVSGWLSVDEGKIVEIGEGRPPERGENLAGDYLLPGLVELHTDHLESHVVPRPKVRWETLSAIVAYDLQMAGAGITTVFDSLRVGTDADSKSLGSVVLELVSGLDRARSEGLLRAEHLTHLRCEIAAHDVLDDTEALLANHSIDLISLMDHTPGARQFRDVETWKVYYGGKSGRSESELERLIAERRRLYAENHDRHRARLVALARERGIVLASHDDTTPEHVAQSRADGIAIAEFPTTLEAAAASHAAGIQVMMGAPNVVRGGSHSGNVAAETLARAGVLDILSSDYVPASLLMGAFDLARRIETMSLPEAVRMVTLNPARATGLDDRGALAPGLRADLVRVHMAGDVPVVRVAWREGRRVA